MTAIATTPTIDQGSPLSVSIMELGFKGDCDIARHE